jgi:hypothetical protein
MVQTKRGSVTGSKYNSDRTMNFQMATMNDTNIMYVVGTMQYYSLLISDLYNVERDALNENAVSSILAPIRLYQTEIVEGWMTSQDDALEDVIQHSDIIISLRRKDDIDIKLGNTQVQLKTTKRQFKIAALSSEDTQIVFRIKGFPREAVTTSPIYSPGDESGGGQVHSKSQHITVCAHWTCDLPVGRAGQN